MCKSFDSQVLFKNIYFLYSFLWQRNTYILYSVNIYIFITTLCDIFDKNYIIRRLMRHYTFYF